MTSQTEVTSSPVVATVFAHLLTSIHEGTLQPGERISDGKIAADFGVSRTPVREAIQMLRTIGVIEASANRFTRVAVVSPKQTVQAMAVWVALYSALVLEVAKTAPDEVIASMRAAHERFLEFADSGNYVELAKANFDFFEQLRSLSSNPILDRSITGVVHIIRLGSLHLPEALDMEQLAGRQSDLLDALTAHDTDAAVAAIEQIREIRIPQE